MRIIKTVGDLINALQEIPLDTPILIKDDNPEHRIVNGYQQNLCLKVANVGKELGTTYDLFDGMEYQFEYYKESNNKNSIKGVFLR